MSIGQRIIVVLAAVLGASGVAAAAASSHGGQSLLAPYALIALTHAPALLALALLTTTLAFRIAALTLAVGATLFCADLGARHLFGGALFPFAAPLGGVSMIAGWVLTGVGALAARHG